MSTPKQSRMPDFSRNSSLDEKLSLENLCLIHKDKSTEGLFKDVHIPCNNRNCRFNSSNSFDNSKKKGKANKLTTHTSGRKRIRFFRDEDEQDEVKSNMQEVSRLVNKSRMSTIVKKIKLSSSLNDSKGSLVPLSASDNDPFHGKSTLISSYSRTTVEESSVKSIVDDPLLINKAEKSTLEWKSCSDSSTLPSMASVPYEYCPDPEDSNLVFNIPAGSSKMDTPALQSSSRLAKNKIPIITPKFDPATGALIKKRLAIPGEGSNKSSSSLKDSKRSSVTISASDNDPFHGKSTLNEAEKSTLEFKSCSDSSEKSSVRPLEFAKFSPENSPLSSFSNFPQKRSSSRAQSGGAYPPYKIGLRNIDSTCYVNATLKALFALPGFTDDLVTAFEGTENLPHFDSLLANMIAARKKGLPDEVDKLNEDLVKDLHNLHKDYKVRQQQDACEFLIRLIEHLRLAIPAGPINPVESHFECEMIEFVHCTACGKKKKRAQKQTSICLPMQKKSRKLEQCLQDYMAEDERELTYRKCKANTSKITSKFRTLPRVLIMLVNLFSEKGDKLANHIILPQVLDIRPFLENSEQFELPSEYALAARIDHIGQYKSSGHYVSHVYFGYGVWRCYNDECVSTALTPDEVESVYGETAYVYFYVHQRTYRHNGVTTQRTTEDMPDVLDDNTVPPEKLFPQNEEVFTSLVSSQRVQNRKLNDKSLVDRPTSPPKKKKKPNQFSFAQETQRPPIVIFAIRSKEIVLKEILSPFLPPNKKNARRKCHPGDGRENGIIFACLYRLLQCHFTLAPDTNLINEVNYEELGISKENWLSFIALMDIVKSVKVKPDIDSQTVQSHWLPPSLGTLVGYRGLDLHRDYLQSSKSRPFVVSQNNAKLTELDDEGPSGQSGTVPNSVKTVEDPIADAYTLLFMRIMTLFLWPGIMSSMVPDLTKGDPTPTPTTSDKIVQKSKQEKKRDRDEKKG